MPVNRSRSIGFSWESPGRILLLRRRSQGAFVESHPYPELLNIQKRYNQMAEWHWRANDNLQAVDAMQKGMEALKSKEGLLSTELALFAYQLRQYENR